MGVLDKLMARPESLAIIKMVEEQGLYESKIYFDENFFYHAYEGGVIKEWVSKHGRLTIGSTNEKRTKYYHKWLCSELTCGGFNDYGKLPHGESQYGFTIE